MQFGAYKTVRELVSGSTATIFLAVDSSGDTGKPRFAIKLCTAGIGIDNEWLSEEEREKASARVWDFLASTTRQKRAHAAGARHLAAIHDGGSSEHGPWFATDYYPRTAHRLIEGHVTLTPEALHHILHAVVLGAVECKVHTGETHGNIKPTNVLLGGDRDLSQAVVVLSDPFASKANITANLEVADLQAIGELLYQLVRRRGDVSGVEHWPIETSNDWTTMFGEAAPEWLTLCNQLLDPNLGQSGLTLEVLKQQLDRLKPKESGAWLKMAAVIVAVGLVGLGGWLSWRHVEQKRDAKRIASFQAAVAGAESAFQIKDYAATMEALARASTLVPSDPEAKERTATEIQKLADLKSKLEFEFHGFVAAAQAALSGKQYAQAETTANQALVLKPGDQTAKRIAEEAQTQLAAMGQVERQFQTLVAAARAALESRQYAEAQAKANQALGLKPGDQAAKQIVEQAQAQVAGMLKLETDYKAAIATAQTALDAKQYAQAATAANQALVLKPGDQTAKRIVEQAQAQVAAMSKLETDYKAAITVAQTALDAKQYAQAETAANQALGLKPGDQTAKRIVEEAQTQLAAMGQLERQFQTLVAAAKAALESKQYTEARAKANQALSLKPGDQVAKGIVEQAQAQQVAMLKLENDYKAALAAAQNALDKKQYTEVEAKASQALVLKPGDQTAKGILAEAQKQVAAMLKLETGYKAAVAAAEEALKQKKYVEAEAKASQALVLKPGDQTAKGILAEAQQQVAAMLKLENDYKASLAAAQNALDKKQYTEAEAKANQALVLRPGDRIAKGIAAEAQKQMAAMLKLENDYKASLAAAQNALDKKQYTEAEAKANQALVLRPGDQTAKGIVAEVQKQVAAMQKLETDYKAAVVAFVSATNDGKLALALFRANEAMQLRQSPEAASMRDLSIAGMGRLMEANNYSGMKQAMRDLPVETRSKAPFDAYWQWLVDRDPEVKLRRELLGIDLSMGKTAVRLNRKEQLEKLGLTPAQTGERYDPTVLVPEKEVLDLKQLLDAWVKQAEPVVPDAKTLKQKREGVYQVLYKAWERQ